MHLRKCAIYNQLQRNPVSQSWKWKATVFISEIHEIDLSASVFFFSSWNVSRDLECNLQFNAINFGLLPLSHVQFRLCALVSPCARERDPVAVSKEKKGRNKVWQSWGDQIMDDVVTVGAVLLRFCQQYSSPCVLFWRKLPLQIVITRRSHLWSKDGRCRNRS